MDWNVDLDARSETWTKKKTAIHFPGGGFLDFCLVLFLIFACLIVFFLVFVVCFCSSCLIVFSCFFFGI